jgi:hypothetical protein
MPAAKAKTSGAAKKKEAAPRLNGKPKTLDFRGVSILLPPKLMGSVLFRWARLRDDDLVGATKLAESIIGKEQFDRVLDKMDEDGIEFDDVEGMTEVGTLINKAFDAFGMSAGESSASGNS